MYISEQPFLVFDIFLQMTSAVKCEPIHNDIENNKCCHLIENLAIFPHSDNLPWHGASSGSSGGMLIGATAELAVVQLDINVASRSHSQTNSNRVHGFL